MKLLIRVLCFLSVLFGSYTLSAQTQAQLNWDNLDYYYNSATAAPYASYITTTQAAIQKFAIGTTYLTITTPAVQTFVNGENGTHTGNVTVSSLAYTGDDAQFTPSTDGQQIKLTFATAVQDVKFTLYDIDASAVFNISATDAFSLPKIINGTLQATTDLTFNTTLSVPTNNTANLTVRSTSTTSRASTLNNGTATIAIAGAVKEVIITVTTRGSDAAFWLSDIYATVSGTFPVNYHQMASTKPFTGQPDYFLTTPDNNYVYMVDAASGRATMLFQDTENPYVNSLAYDAVHHTVYYVTDGTLTPNSTPKGTGDPANNKQLKKYDFETGLISIVNSNLSALLGFPTFDQGFESGAACFYDGALYLGVEGGRFTPNSSSVPRESIIYKIEFDGNLVPVNAYQVWATPAYNPTTTAPNPTYSSSNTTVGSMSIHDWGDFLIKDGTIYDFNTARTSVSGGFIYPNSSVYRVNMMTGVVTNFWNPNQSLTAAASAPYVGQVSLDWAGNLYSIRNSIQKFNLTDSKLYHPTTNVLNGGQVIVASSGSPSWVGNAGDASEPFRPKVDLGDAPASYDPDPNAPAVHGWTDNKVRLGDTLDREWNKTASADANADGSDEDGLAFTYVYNNGTNYIADVKVYNNPATNNPDTSVATLAAWLDFNMNGVFDESEGVATTVAKSATLQTITLKWPANSYTIPRNTNTYLRVRIASNSVTAANNLTIAKPTGYMPNGEVEDYYVLANVSTLAVQKIDFNTVKEVSKVALKWSVTGIHDVDNFIVARSTDKINWQTVTKVAATGSSLYTTYDNSPFNGVTYYRLQAVERSGQSLYSPIREVDLGFAKPEIHMLSNPANASAAISIYTLTAGKATLRLINPQGVPLTTETLLLPKGNTSRNIPTSNLPSGMYFYELQQGAFLERRKLLVAH